MFEEKLKEFHVKYGHFVLPSPGLPPHSVISLRKALIREEHKETQIALEKLYKHRDHCAGGCRKCEEMFVELMDGIADLTYVLIGTSISFGLPFTEPFCEVHDSNMTKTEVKATEGQKYGTKTPKGPDFRPPNLLKMLRK